MPARLAVVTALVAVLLAGLLAGCRLDVTVTTTVARDGSGTVAVEAVADAELLDRVPGLLTELRLDDAADAGWTVEGPAAERDGGATVRLTKSFRTPAEATATLQELNGPQGPFHDLAVDQVERFAEVETTFTGRVELEGGLEAFADADLVALVGNVPLADVVTVPVEEGLGLAVVAALPGEVEDTTGSPVAAGITRWEPPLADGAVTDMAATALDRDEGALAARRTRDLALVGLVIWAAVVAGLGVVWWARRRARGSAATPPA